jgi:hypothetical protein
MTKPAVLKTSHSDHELTAQEPLTSRDVYLLLGVVLTRGGYADGSPDRPEVRRPESFRDLAEHLRYWLQVMGVEVEDGEIPVLPHASEGVPGKYVAVYG